MTKSELIERLARRFPNLSGADVRIATGHILEGLASALAKGQRIEIRGFGSFGVRERKPRVARNPKTGARVAVLAKAVPYFKSGNLLRERVNSRPKETILSRKRYRLEDLLAQIPPGTRFEELYCGPAVGREIL